MKARTLIVAGTASFLLTSVAYLPASLLAKLLPASLPVQMQDVGGTLWQGHAIQVTWQNQTLKQLQWHWHAWPLLQGKVAMELTALPAAGGVVEANCTWGLLNHRLQCDPLAFKDIPASVLNPYAQRLLVPPLSGAFQGNALAVAWQAGQQGLPAVQGEIIWQGAGVQMLPQRYGDYRVNMATAADGLLTLDVSSAPDAAFTVDGGVKVQPNGRFDTLLNLRPTPQVDANTKQFLSSFIVRPQPDGTYRIQLQGQVPGWPPAK